MTVQGPVSNSMITPQNEDVNIFDDRCGKYKFIDVDITTDKFWIYLKNCGADIDQIVNILSKQNILFGKKEKTIHECAKHLTLQMDQLKMPVFVQHLIQTLIDNEELENAANLLKKF